MDESRFDGLARTLARGTTRRSTLGALVGLAAAGGLGAVEVGAKKNKKKDPCKRTCKSCGNYLPITSTKYDGCDFENVAGKGQNVSGSSFQNACLSYADFRDANFQGVSLRGACLQGANLSGANLQGVSFVGANTDGLALYGTDLRGAKLTQEQIDAALIGCGTILPNSQVIGACGPGELCCEGQCTMTAEGCGCGYSCSGAVYDTCGEGGHCAQVSVVDGTCACVEAYCGADCESSSDCYEEELCVTAPGCCDNAGGSFCASLCGADSQVPEVASASGGRGKRFAGRELKSGKKDNRAKKHKH